MFLKYRNTGIRASYAQGLSLVIFIYIFDKFVLNGAELVDHTLDAQDD